METTVERSPKKQFMYMAVTNDELELPVFFADSGKELARVTGVAASTVLAYVCRDKNADRYAKNDTCNRFSKMKLKYIKVELPNDDEDLMADVPPTQTTFMTA